MDYLKQFLSFGARSLRYAPAMFVVATFVAFPLSSSVAGTRFGPRVGYGVNPDQFVIGAQSVHGKALKIARFSPSIDIGFGDNVTTFVFNGDLRLNLISPPKSGAKFYAGVGPTIMAVDTKFGRGDTEIGLTFHGGLQFPMGEKNSYTLEARVGLGDIPDARILLGVLFGGASKAPSSK